MSQAPTKPNRIDFAAIADRADLGKLITDQQGEPIRGPKWLCPFHSDHNPSLGLTKDGKRYRCFACGEKGDALAWLIKTGAATDVVDAARQLDPSISPRKGGADAQPKRPTPSPPPAPAPRPDAREDDPAWKDGPWQSEVDRVIREAETALWSAEGRPALGWLRSRGFHDWLIAKFRLGYLPTDWRSEPLAILPPKDGKPGRLWFPRGITIPWVAPLAWYGDRHHDTQPLSRWVGLNVRRLNPDVFEPWTGGAKYIAAKMAPRGYGYPFPDGFAAGVNALVVEGELDSLIAHQHLGHLAHAITAGGANQDPDPDLAAEMKAKSRYWLLAVDADAAGERAVERWRRIGFDRCRRLLLPPGRKDLGEMAEAGDDIAAWFASETRRLGLADLKRRGSPSCPQ